MEEDLEMKSNDLAKLPCLCSCPRELGHEADLLSNRPSDFLLISYTVIPVDLLLRSIGGRANGLLCKHMLPSEESGLNEFGLVLDGQRDDDSDDIISRQQVFVRLACSGVLRIQVNSAVVLWY